MLRLEQVSLSFGERALLDGVDWAVRDRDRIGLVGPNGAGKTTLLRIAAGDQEVDAGVIQVGRGQSVGYLPQDGVSLSRGPLMEVVCTARADLVELEARIAAHLRAMEELDAADPEHEVRLGKLQRDQDAYEIRGGYTQEAVAGRILRGLGFDPEDRDRACASFSRGWQMRIALARLLVQRPEFLLLDEPTNHLDMESRAWLERFLDEYDGAVVVVSHDRHFLDRVVERVAEVDRGRLTQMAGNYSAFEVVQAQRRAQLTEAAARQAREVARIQQFVSKFRYDKRRASQVQSRVKALQKMESIDLPERRASVKFRFPPPPRCGSPVVSTRDLGAAYGDLRVFGDVNVTVSRGERVAVVGPNGAGKSTLLRLVGGRQRPSAGDSGLGHNVVVAYFAQDQLEEMKPEHTVFDEIRASSPGTTDERLRNVLGAFLFQGDDVDKPVDVLSGGERNRLALSKFLLKRANLLLLDEPTNHLDMASKDVLAGALKDFDGTVMFVSHDRYFVEALADRVIEVGGGKAEWYPGGFEDFLWRKARELGYDEARIEGLPAPDLWLLGARADLGEEREAPRKTGGDAYRERIRRDRARERAEREVARSMTRIEELESAVAELLREMEDPEVASDFQRVAALQQQIDEAQAEIATLYERWEELQGEVEG